MSTELSLSDEFYCTPLSLVDFDEVVALEPLCYPNPWSREVLYNEFSKDVSLRVAVRLGTSASHSVTIFAHEPRDPVVGYSFNHLILDELHILNLAVAPEFRLRGLGQMLLTETITRAQKLGATRAFLEVRPSNTAALALYEKFNFRKLGLRKCYYRDNGEDAFLMESTLKQS